MHFRVTLLPVSYTHLDVYKRQAFGYDGRTEAEEIHLEFIDNDTMKLDSDTFARVKPQG